MEENTYTPLAWTVETPAFLNKIPYNIHLNTIWNSARADD